VDWLRFELRTTRESTASAYRSREGRRPDPSAYLCRFQRLIRPPHPFTLRFTGHGELLPL